MKVLVSWLRDFVTIPVGIDELAAALNMRGFEVAAVDPPPPGVEGSGDDAVIDLEVTPNRPDCLGVVGLAREVATIYDTALHGSQSGPPEAPASGARAPGPADGDALPVTIEDVELCPRYAAGLAEVTVSPSPGWLAGRLQAVGVRPINNVVDVTNYVMIETGHPTHAFDLERLAGRELRIRRARGGEGLRTLDGADRTLTTDMLIIADAERPQAVAGVMGGADAEVTAGTRVVALESAYFQPVSVRRTSRQLGLSTDASYRFERGADISAPVAALERVRGLLEQIGGGRARGSAVDRYPQPRSACRVTLRHSRIRRLLGQDIDATLVGKILERLGFTLAPLPAGGAGVEGPRWEVTVPTHRVDVGREADLIEEVARHYGYDRLPTTFPALTQPPAATGTWLDRDRLVRRVLAASGFSEAITFAFVERAAAAAFHAEDDLVRLANPLSEKFAVLRPSLLPGIVDSIVHNCRRERRDVRLFEIGSRFSVRAGETPGVAVGWTGAAAPDHWSGGSRPVDLFDLKGVVERLCSTLGVRPRFEPLRRPDLLPGCAATVRAASTGPSASDRPDEVVLGSVGQVVPALAAARGLPAAAGEVYVAEIDLEALTRIADTQREVLVEPLPRYPSIVRDLSIVVDEDLSAASVRGTIRASAAETLVSIREFDRYLGQGVPAGRVSLSLRLTFRAPDRTLTDAEVQQTMEVVVGALEKAHEAKVR